MAKASVMPGVALLPEDIAHGRLYLASDLGRCVNVRGGRGRGRRRRACRTLISSARWCRCSDGTGTVPVPVTGTRCFAACAALKHLCVTGVQGHTLVIDNGVLAGVAGGPWCGAVYSTVYRRVPQQRARYPGAFMLPCCCRLRAGAEGSSRRVNEAWAACPAAASMLQQGDPSSG